MTQAAGIVAAGAENIAPGPYSQPYEEALGRIAELEALVATLRKENRELRLEGAPLPNSGFHWLTGLQYKLKGLGARVASFESGDKYIEMRAEFKAQLAEKDREIRKLKGELADANARHVTMREKWYEVYEDLEKAHGKELEKKGRELKEMEKRALNAERQRDEAKDKLLEKTREVYRAQTELDEEKGKNLKLTARINQNHENSSKPSSMNPNHKKITNTR